MKKNSVLQIVFLSGLFLFLPALAGYGAEKQLPEKKWKILHIMSYHLPWEWTETQFNGFKKALQDLDVEYRVFQMDTKRQSSEKWKEQKGKEARELIASWKPDLVYVSDDDAQEYVTRHYVGREIPFVFSAVNAAPETYGFRGAKNIAGVLEEEHFVASVKLLTEIVPAVGRIAVILDRDPMWKPVAARMKDRLPQLPQVRFVSWHTIKTFGEFRQKMKALPQEADAVALIGIFGFKDAAGNNVSYRDVIKWTVEYSRLPDFSFWKDRVSYGTLSAVTVSGYEQGLRAGKIARGILKEGRSPASYAMRPSVKGEPVISLARARKLGIKIRTSLLLSSQIVEKFAWDK